MRLTFLWQQNETGLMMCASGKKFLLKKKTEIPIYVPYTK